MVESRPSLRKGGDGLPTSRIGEAVSGDRLRRRSTDPRPLGERLWLSTTTLDGLGLPNASPEVK